MNRTLSVLVLFLVACDGPNFHAGKPWDGAQATATTCALEGGATVQADGPVFCGAIEANLRVAFAADRYTAQEEASVRSTLVIEVHTQVKCLEVIPGLKTDSAHGNCTLAESSWSGVGDGADWHIEYQIHFNLYGTNFTHEFRHVLLGYQMNFEGAPVSDALIHANSFHEPPAWTQADLDYTNEADADTYKVTP